MPGRRHQTIQLIEYEAVPDESTDSSDITADGMADITMGLEDDAETRVRREATRRGQLADEAGGSIANAVRMPRPLD